MILRRMIVCLLVATIFIVSFGIDSFSATNTQRTFQQGDTIEVGSYPQSEVLDNELLEHLNSLPLEWISYNYYSRTANTVNDTENGEMSQSDFIRYADVFFNGSRYRAVVFDSYRPSDTRYVSNLDGSLSYQDQNRYFREKIYWFKYEPLIWQIIDPNTGLAACASIIDAQPFNSVFLSCGFDDHGSPAAWGNIEMTSFASQYSNSSLREWLNNTFFDTAFSDLEQSDILISLLDNRSFYSLQGKVGYEEYDSSQSFDKVFALSYCDVQNGLFARRRLRGTDYAKCQGVYSTSPSNPGNDCSAWWTRSSVDSEYVYVVPDRFFDNGTQVVSASSIVGICPAIRLQSIKRIFTATFLVDGEVYWTEDFLSEQESIYEPEVPKKPGFTGKWSNYILTHSDVTINAEYTPIQYTATFIANGEKIAEIPFTYGQTSIQLPNVPEKEGYIGAWPDYTLGAENLTIEAVYTPIEYTVTYYSDDQVIGSGAIPYGNSIWQPRTPQKEDYSFTGWTPKVPETMPANDLTFYAVFEPVTYYATFMADGKQVGEKIPYTLETAGINPPAVPEKAGYTGAWEPYTLTIGGVTINAVYSKIPTLPAIKIRNFAATKSVDYKTTITFTAVVTDAPEGTTVHWFIDDRDVGTGETYKKEQTTASYTVQCKLMQGSTVLAESEIETVKVNTGFFAKLIAFFKGLFGSLPVITQAIKETL